MHARSYRFHSSLLNVSLYRDMPNRLLYILYWFNSATPKKMSGSVSRHGCESEENVREFGRCSMDTLHGSRSIHRPAWPLTVHADPSRTAPEACMRCDASLAACSTAAGMQEESKARRSQPASAQPQPRLFDKAICPHKAVTVVEVVCMHTRDYHCTRCHGLSHDDA